MDARKSGTLVWEWPLRLWHWLLVVAVSTALVTGLIPELDLMNIHTWAGMTVVALLVFRLVWGLIGGTYSRLRHYITTPKLFVNHFRSKNPPMAHTSPGIVLAVCLLLALIVQSSAGLFTTDDVFLEGPFVQFANDDLVELASDIHSQVWKFILVFIGIHLSAHLVYGIVLRDPIALSMFTGRKQLDICATNYAIWNSVLVYVGSGAVLFVLWLYSR